MTVLSVKEVGKAFRTYRSEWHRFARWFGLALKPAEEAWVLRHINFDIQPGEAIGIVGQNGAGKSTLLKIITGTLQPSEGQVQVNGRIAAILELGMGFNPELTGHQNVRHAAGLMGFSPEQIDAAMPDIEAFAEIGEYFNEPVRTYSSGMQMRVAFAVATAWRPEILIVDEALAVGDAAFQRKCHRRIETFIQEGTSLLFVSHDIEGIKKLCRKALYLAHGRLVAAGDAKSVCDQYETMLFGGKSANDQSKSITATDSTQRIGPLIDPSLLGSHEVAYGNGSAVIERVWIENSRSQEANVLISGETFSVCYVVHFHEEFAAPVMAMLIKTLEGIALYGTDSKSQGKPLGHIQAGTRCIVRFQMECRLSAGTYFLNCGIRDPLDAGNFLHRRVDVAMFKVNKESDKCQAGLVDLCADLSVEQG